MPYPLILDGRVIQIPDHMFDVAPGLSWGPPREGVQIGDAFDGTSYTTLAEPPAPAPTLADRRAALAAERYAKQSSGVLFKAAAAGSSSLTASDATSMVMIGGSYAAARDGYWVDGTPWKMADGSFVPLTADDMKALAVKVLGYIARCFAREAELSAALAIDLTTDITQDWPANG